METITYKRRDLTESEEAAIDVMYRRKDQHRPAGGYVTTTELVEMSEWNGDHSPSVEANTTTKKIHPGATLKIVMVSRFGDCGLSDDLDADYGYGLRLPWDHAAMSNIRLAR